MRPISDESRHEMTIAAAMRERRNRPLGFVLASAVLLAICAVAALLGVADRARAAATLRTESQVTEQMKAQVAELEGLRAAAEGAVSGAGHEPIRDIDVQTKLEQVAQEVGLKEKARTSRASSQVRGRVRVFEFQYQDLRTENLPSLLEWIRASEGAVPGLEVYRLELRFDTTGVPTMTVTLRRWERAQ